LSDLYLNPKWKFSKIYKAVWEADVSAKAKLVWAALEWYGEKKYPSHETLAKMCSLGITSVQRAIAELEKAGFLAKANQPGRPNNYELFPEGEIGTPVKLTDHHGQIDRPTPPDPGQIDRRTILRLNDKGSSQKPTRPFTDWWVAEFMLRNNRMYAFHGAKDAKAAQKLVGLYDLETLKGMVLSAWDNPDQWIKKVSQEISGFLTIVNRLPAPAKNKYGGKDEKV
jgi:hypothetical protein